MSPGRVCFQQIKQFSLETVPQWARRVGIEKGNPGKTLGSCSARLLFELAGDATYSEIGPAARPERVKPPICIYMEFT